MFNYLLSSLKAENSNEEYAARRKHARREADSCVTVIDGRTYPIENWSTGGLMIQGDERLFGVDDEYNLVLKFKLSEKIIDVPHRGRVVRKNRNKIAFEFKPLTQQIRNNFQFVVDDYVTSQFAQSQSSI
jgi:hypothetical protein